MQDEAGHIQAHITRLAAEGADAARIAEAAASSWRAVDAALSPIISQRGVAALYKRSLYLTRAAHTALAAVHDGELLLSDYTALQAALAQQTSLDAAAANGALLQAFCDLLTHLIGASLTGQLLRSAGRNASSGDAVEDTTL